MIERFETKFLKTNTSSIIFATSLLVFYFATIAHATSHNLPKSTQQDLEFIELLSKNPRLLNANYLDCYLGARASAASAPFSKSLRSPGPVFRTYWQDKIGHSVAYRLEDSKPTITNYLAEFETILTPQDDVRIEDLDQILDGKAKYSLDEDGHSNRTYYIKTNDRNYASKQDDPSVIYTKVLAYQDASLVNVTRVVVQYNGPPLLKPTVDDMDEATAFRRNSAFEQHRLGHNRQAQRLLQSHLKAHPEDAEAHLVLAQSYKAQSCLNESIAEYKIALSKCGDNSELRDKCLEGLQTFKIPTSAPPAIITPASRSFPSAQPGFNINPAHQSLSTPIESTPTDNNPKNLEVGF